MSVLIVGISHQTAPVALLERLALDADQAGKLAQSVAGSEHVAEALVVATCNRVEVYADVDRFHGSVEDVSELLSSVAGGARADVIPHLYVHYDDAAIAHLFAVAAGLDSMVVGESQILGQVRAALQRGQEQDSVGPVLNGAFQQALRVGKRGHAETGIDQAAPSAVTAALDRLAELGVDAKGATAMVVGAGAMAGLAVAQLSRRGAAQVVVVNRTPQRAERLAASVRGRAADLRELPAELAAADLLVSCTGATGVVVSAEHVAAALSARSPDRPLGIVDLALPHDVDPIVTRHPAVRHVGLAALATELADGETAKDVADVRRIVGEEVAAYVGARGAARVTPTVVALRSMATEVVDAELGRLLARLPDLDDDARAEVELAVRRVAGKLLHAPTTRVKELTGQPAGMSYAEVLAELFSLPSGTVEAVTQPEGGAVTRPVRIGTRASALARVQSTAVANRIAATGRTVELVDVTTKGDVDAGPLTAIGGAGVFTSALRDALLAGELDVAVHSLKDLPTAPLDGLVVAAVPTRNDPRDVVVARDGHTLAALPAGSTVGTGAPRRSAQLHALGFGLEVVDVRGNVDTRLAKVAHGDLDAVLLARAGLARLDRLDAATEVLDPMQMLPAPGQGALAVECRADDALVAELRDLLDDPDSRAAVTAERAFLAVVEAGCLAPLGALAERVSVDDETDELWLRGVVVDPSGQPQIRLSATGSPLEPEAVGAKLAAEMLAAGAADLIRAGGAP